MKKLLFILLLISSVGCKDEDSVSMVDPSSTTLTFPLSGIFVSAPNETMKGSAMIIDDDGDKSLIFDETFMASGPDLKVYLSTDAIASDYTSLGSVKNSSGTQTYRLSNDINLLKYRYVVIWCEKFSVRFGTAELK